MSWFYKLILTSENGSDCCLTFLRHFFYSPFYNSSPDNCKSTCKWSCYSFMKTLVLFGGNPTRRQKVIDLLAPIEGLSVIRVLSEEEGIALIHQAERIDMVLIGGRYSPAQRQHIKVVLRERFPKSQVTEPGVDYPYDDQLIVRTVEDFLNGNNKNQ